MKLSTIFLALLLFFAGFLAGNVRKHRAIRLARDAEYIRVVGQVAEAYGYDPSEVETDAGLVDERGEIKR
jgi:hypothetical protein